MQQLIGSFNIYSYLTVKSLFLHADVAVYSIWFKSPQTGMVFT